jgi:hypothetical protein
MIAYMSDGYLLPASDAFSIDNKGNIEKHVANKDKKRSVRLTRKTALTKRMISFGRAIEGSVFQLSNVPDFKNSVDILQFPEHDTLFIPKTIDINEPKSYRYARYKAKRDFNIELAELQWFSGEKRLKGKIIGSELINYSGTREKLFDDDVLSFYTSYNKKGSRLWVGLDFGKKEHITKLKVATRSDLNYINPGDTYELLYWDNQWISLQTKVSNDYFIEFENVPEGALLWLKNLSEGIEEELFVYKNGKQYFWGLSNL